MLVKYHGQDSEVVIPDGVTSVGKRAFYRCLKLESVVLPASVAIKAVVKCGKTLKCKVTVVVP